MAKDSVTLALNGDIPLHSYVLGVQRFAGLIEALSDELAGKAELDWVVSDLAAGSAVTTARAEPRDSADIEYIDRIVHAYVDVGRSLAKGERILRSDRVIREALGLEKLLDGRVTSIRFENADEDVTIINPGFAQLPGPRYVSSYGAVEGQIQTLTSRKGLRFTLFDSLYDQAVSCYLDEGQEETMRGLWGRRAIVEGWVSRDPLSGRPVTIRHISEVIPLADAEPGGFERAAGILPREPDQPAPEELIRQLRDAW